MTSFFSPPTFADADKTLAARLLNGASLSIGATALVGAVLIPFTAPARLWSLYFVVVSLIFLICMLVFWMLRRGSTQLASWLLVTTIWLGITITALTSGGVQSTAYIGYVGVIMLTGLLLGGTASVVVTALSVLAGLMMSVGVVAGWLPSVVAHSPIQGWAVSGMLLAVSALIQQFASGTLAELLKRARDSEANYRMLFEEAPDGILIADVENRFEMVNPAVCRMLGFSPEEFMGKGLINLIAPEDLERLPIGKPEEIRVLGGRKRERLIVRKDGTRVPIIISSRYMPDGRFQYILQDITGRKEVEERERMLGRNLRAVVEATDDLIACPDLDTFYRRAVELAREKLGVERCGIFLLDPSRENLVGTYGTDMEGRTTNEHDYIVPTSVHPNLFRPNAQHWLIQERDHTYWDERHEREAVVGKGWVGLTVIRSGGEPIGMLANDAAITGSPFYEVTSETIAVYCSLLGSIVERKRAEEALRQSEGLYRRAIEAAGAVPYYLDYATGHYSFVGNKMVDITGYSSEEITPDLMGSLEQEYQLLGEAVGLTKDEAVRRVRAGQIRVWKNDSRIRTRSGESRWVSDTSVQTLNESGGVIGSIGIVQDITERKQAELALRYSEGLHRRAIEAAGAVPYYRDHTLGAFTLMGDGIRQLTGYGPGEMTPQLFDTLVVERVMMGESASISPEDATRRARTGQISIWQCDCKIRHRDGTYRWIADSAVEVLGESSLSRGSVGILQDITERKEALEEVQRLNAELEQRVAYRTEALRASEARFRATNDASPLGIFVDDPNGECVYTNVVYHTITGLSAEHALGQGWISAVHPGDRDAVAAGWDAARRRTPFRFEQVYRIRRRDGRVVWVSVKASVMRDGDELLGYVGTVEDITSRVEAEESLRRRTAQLEAANKELEAFSYSISHDLRAPLRAMDGFSRLLTEQFGDSFDPEAMRYLQKVRDNAQYMGHLIDDLLAFSRLGRHALRLQYLTSADLAALARRLADDACAEALDRRFKVFVGDLPPCEADLGLLTQVFVNLLTNAVKFTRPRTVAEIEIGSLSADDGPAYFVRDNGVGFDMQYVHKVFGVFQRLHRVEDFEGTGVGLAIVQRIIQRHGGRIWVEAVPDKGATFCFTIGKAQTGGE